MPNFHESFSKNSKFAKDEEKSNKKVETKAVEEGSREDSTENVIIPGKRVTADKKVEDAIKSKKDKTGQVNESENDLVGDCEDAMKIQEVEVQKVEDTESRPPKDKVRKMSNCSKQKHKSKQSEVKQKRTTRSSIDTKKNPEQKPTKKTADPKNATTEPSQKPKKNSVQKPKPAPVPLSVQLMLVEARNKYLARKSGAHFVQVPMTIIHHVCDLSGLKKLP